jgi:hypothetical protein
LTMQYDFVAKIGHDGLLTHVFVHLD